ncbi:hypothetical protein [Roseinatronobacter sp. S2]|uniref:hypothetical protein n=1 Tax=Roseinatronobacter sp. S2 TaxID=3035471 RepID=UPI00240F5FF2|nr:hypothetical protein [Roseinatronobacter sp. S2]WFE73472.1 hypothetical protein P8S53_09745 [Roseinatronobacter sp. S2]
MKTNFALGITESGVTLWQRGERGWLRVGAVALDHENLDAAVADLVGTAAKLGSDKFVTQLVIPDDQILYTRISAPGPGIDAQRSQIRKALEGRTPFPVEELDFDWTGAGPDVDVAVVARETLIEAEDFAKKHKLNPVCFVAAPASGAFKHAPFFGTSRAIRDIIGDPEKLVRDREILHETGVAAPPVAPPPPAAKATAAPAADKTTPAPDKATADKEPPQSKPAETESAKTDTTPDNATVPPKKLAGEKRTDSAAGADLKDAKTGTKTAGTKSAPKASESAAPKGAQDDILPGFMTRRKPEPTLDGKSAAASGAKPDTSLTGLTQKLAGIRDADDQQENAAEACKTAQGLRGTYASANARIAESMGQLRARFMSAKKTVEQDSPKPAAAPMLGLPKRRQDEIPAAKSEAWQPPAQKTPAKRTEAPKATDWTPASRPTDATQSATTRKSPLETLRSIGQTSAAGATSATDPEAERLTVFGARGTAAGGASTPKLKSRLLIGGGIVMILAAAAVWAFYFARPAPPEIPVTLAPAPEAAVDTPAPLEDDPATAEADAIEAALGVEDVAERGPETDATTPDGASTSALADEDATQIENGTAPSAEMDQGRIAGLRSSTLIMPQELAALPASPEAPQPFGTDPLPPLRSELEAQDTQDMAALDASEPDTSTLVDEQGLPAGEEALEIGVTQGRPTTAPPEKPVRFTLPEAPEPEAEPEAAEPDASDADVPDAPDLPQEDAASQPAETTDTPDDASDGDTASAALDESDLEIVITPGTPPVVPPSRPEALQPDTDQSQGQAPSQTDEIQQASGDATAGGLALSALRPASRPSDLAARAEAIIERQTPRIENATPQAVAASLRPSDRPSAFASTVQRALNATSTAAAAPAAQSTPQAPVQTASAAAAQPNIPSSASVSREATQARAINLRQFNLIGVMGTSSNRRALVRLSNGRVLTVRVGESLDGGQVTAIGETELRYNRRGRDVVLRIAS